jgi:hypothetical protein
MLSNLVLDELDRGLDRRGRRFVRYADDCNIYVRGEKTGRRVMASLTRFIERRLKLQIDTEKSAVARPWHRSFRGFTVKDDPVFRRRIAAKAMARNMPVQGSKRAAQMSSLDSPQERDGFELVWGFSCQVVVFGLLRVLCSERESRSSFFNRAAGGKRIFFT